MVHCSWYLVKLVWFYSYVWANISLLTEVTNAIQTLHMYWSGVFTADKELSLFWALLSDTVPWQILKSIVTIPGFLLDYKNAGLGKKAGFIFTCPKGLAKTYASFVSSESTSHDNWCTVWGNGGCRVGEIRAGTTSPMPDHKGFKLQ